MPSLPCVFLPGTDRLAPLVGQYLLSHAAPEGVSRLEFRFDPERFELSGQACGPLAFLLHWIGRSYIVGKVSHGERGGSVWGGNRRVSSNLSVLIVLSSLYAQ